MKTQILTKTQIKRFLKEQEKTGKTIKQLAEEMNQPYHRIYGEIRAYKDELLVKDVMSVDLHANQAKAMEVRGHKIDENRQNKMNVLRRIVIKHPDIKVMEAKSLAERVCSRLGIKKFGQSQSTFNNMFYAAKKEYSVGAIQGA